MVLEVQHTRAPVKVLAEWNAWGGLGTQTGRDKNETNTERKPGPGGVPSIGVHGAGWGLGGDGHGTQ